MIACSLLEREHEENSWGLCLLNQSCIFTVKLLESVNPPQQHWE